MVVLALRVIRQHLDDPAFADAAMRAIQDHALQFLLERSQLAEPLVDLGEMAAGYAVGFRTGAVRIGAELQ